MMTDLGEDGHHLVVNICSVRNWSDPACLLVASDHPELSHPSYVAYHHARLITPKMLEVAAFGHELKPCEPWSAEVFARICQGIGASEHITPKLAKYFREAA